MPEVKVYWYDGGLMPPRPEELKDGQMMGDENGGIIFIGTKRKDHDRLLWNEPDLITGFRHGTFQPAQTDDPESEKVAMETYGPPMPMSKTGSVLVRIS